MCSAPAVDSLANTARCTRQCHTTAGRATAALRSTKQSRPLSAKKRLAAERKKKKHSRPPLPAGVRIGFLGFVWDVCWPAGCMSHQRTGQNGVFMCTGVRPRSSALVTTRLALRGSTGLARSPTQRNGASSQRASNVSFESSPKRRGNRQFNEPDSSLPCHDSRRRAIYTHHSDTNMGQSTVWKTQRWCVQVGVCVPLWHQARHWATSRNRSARAKATAFGNLVSPSHDYKEARLQGSTTP